MCGRVFQTYNVNQLLRLAGTNLIRNANRHQVSYNVCPTSYIPAVRHCDDAENNHRELDMMKWGYDAGFQFIINARVEELTEKKTFRPLLNSNRCVVIIEGFFEWNAKKEPFAFKPKPTGKEDDLPHLYVAALYAQDETVILLTREATKEISGVHHRMPVILDEDELDMWLDCKKYRFENIINKEILNPKKEKWNSLFFYQLAPYVGDIKNKTDKCLMSIEDYKKELDRVGIKRFFKSVKDTKKEEPKKEEPKKEEVTPKEETPKGDQETPKEETPKEETPNGDQANPEIKQEEKAQDDNIKIEEPVKDNAAGNEEEKKLDSEERIQIPNNPALKTVQKSLDSLALGDQNGDFKVTAAYILTKPNLDGDGPQPKGNSKRRKNFDGKESENDKNPVDKMTKVNPEAQMRRYLYR